MNIIFLNQVKAVKKDESRWFHECSERNIPYVITRRRTSLGDVEWDYITMNSNDDDFLRTQENFIVHELETLVKYYADTKTKMNLKALTGYVKDLPVDHVSDFATDVCNTLTEAFKRHLETNT